MPKLPKNWVPGKGIQRPSQADSISRLVEDSRKKTSDPGHRRRSKRPSRHTWLERLREKTPLEWGAVLMTLLIVGWISRVTLAGSSEPVESGTRSPGVEAVAVPGPRTSFILSADPDDEAEEADMASWAFQVPTGGGGRRAAPARERVDVLSLATHDDPSVERLLRMACTPGDPDREQALRTLGRSETRALPYLLAVFEAGKDQPGADPAVMETVLKILADVSDPSAWAAVRRAAGAGLPELRQEALTLIHESGDPEAIPLALAALGDRAPRVRIQAKRILKQAGSKAHPELVKALWSVQARNSPALGGMVAMLTAEPLPEAVAPLTGLLDHRSKDIRWRVVRTLGTWKGATDEVESQAARAIRRTLADRDPGVRSQAVLALLNLQDRESLPALLEMLLDADESVRDSARRALKGITGKKDVGGSYEAWKSFIEEQHDP